MNRAVRITAIARAGLFIVVFPATLSAAVCPESQLFEPALSFTTGLSPTQMVAQDFNGDGDLDIAVAVAKLSNPGAVGSVAVLLATGLRTFSAPVHYSAIGDPIGIVAGDLNSDGIADLAVSSTGARSISVYLGRGNGGIGDGTFASGVSYAAGASAFHIVAADFDQDGILDLATSSDFSTAVAVIKGLGSGGAGTGTFAAPVSFTIGNVSTGIVASDLNHDGVLDLAATENFAGTIAVLLGTGAATLGPASFGPAAHYPAGVTPFDIGVADFDHDGQLDLAVANVNAGGVVVLKGNGAGGFSISTSISSGSSSSVAPRDVDQDGIMDLLVAQGAWSSYAARRIVPAT